MASATDALRGHAIEVRACRHESLESLRDVHEAIFPIMFENDFFEALAAGRYTTLGAFRGSQLVGVVVWDVTSSSSADRMDGPLLSRLVGCGTGVERKIVYIMTLGVRAGYRRQGLGRKLLDACFASAQALPLCVCVYLHVLDGNVRAMRIYEDAGFIRLHKVSRYYAASTFVARGAVDDDADAHVFALYLRNGVPPASFALLRSWRQVCAICARAVGRRGDEAEANVGKIERSRG